ncbi:MAG: hypothetical protein DWQ36_01725 [Acidobacteria bacterium]|nr:MAG: hypothetical protein DWQ30_16570 [Acidobacteriota bacterium]REK11492.1 MAG: hypothetical protein DWQ36_01725 [Acidobacteriota bacterium]
MEVKLVTGHRGSGSTPVRTAILTTAVFLAAFGVEGLVVLALGGGQVTAQRLVVAAAVYSLLALPVLVCALATSLTLSAAGRSAPRLPWAVAGGVVVALVPWMVGILVFSDGDDPSDIVGYLQIWSRDPLGLALGTIPYAASGIAFAWSVHERRRFGNAMETTKA